MATIDRATAQRFLKIFGSKEIFNFQTFDDNCNRKNARLIRVLCGTLTQHFDELASLNKEGAGIFFTVNETDGKGKRTENIIRVRANFVDLDGAPLEPVMAHGIPPSIVVESSPGRWHAYWFVDDCELADFRNAQQRLASQFGGDPSVCDLPRVMRLPGFLHRKSEPFMTRIVWPLES